MLELFLCSLFSIIPDLLYRRYAQGKRIGKEITLFTVWFELRWGISFCLILSLSLITVIFYFHPSTMAATSAFRTVTVMPEATGRVAETFVEMSQTVSKGQPLFRLDSTAQEASVETARRKLAEIDASLVVANAQLAEAEARIVQARGQLKQARDEFDRRAEVQRRSPGSISERDVERYRVAVETQQGLVDATLAARDAITKQIEFQIPAQRDSAQAALGEAEVALRKTMVVAGTDGLLQQFVLRPGDVVNPMLRPAGILVPRRAASTLIAGFGQIEANVVKVGMIGEVTCVAKPWEIIPVVVTGVQQVIASGQVRATDQLIDVQQLARPGSITVLLEALYPGQLDDLPQGGVCMANTYTNNHDAIADPRTGTLKRIGLHAIDAVGVVHAAGLRLRALLMPVMTLVLGGH